ncbi:MAG: OB-fold nucleic acid binding domain-containing protein [Candidatus Pacebacteria bacterium]|nr:OB-fold nucleic acid binding domain-containing protein [Candidatus Paceibacterota bacterium]
MSREQEIKQIRIDKIAKLQKIGMNAYVDPGSIKRDIKLKEANKNFEILEKEEKTKTVVGRIMAKRGTNKIIFSKIFDGTDDFQVVFKKDILGDEKIKIYEKLFDIGDFAEFEGTFFKTKTGQGSMLVKNFRILTKSLLPLPEK